MTPPRPPFSSDPRRRNAAHGAPPAPDSARNFAEDHAGDILAFLAADAERLRRFLDITGLTPQTLRAAAGEPGFAAGLLDYLASDDRVLTGFAEAHSLDPARIDEVRRQLARPGPGDDP